MASATVEDAGPCKKMLKISVPHDDIQAKLDENYEQLRQSAHIDGFRVGHVPRKLLEKRFGEMVCYHPPTIDSVPIAQAVTELRCVDPGGSAVQAASSTATKSNIIKVKVDFFMFFFSKYINRFIRKTVYTAALCTVL